MGKLQCFINSDYCYYSIMHEIVEELIICLNFRVTREHIVLQLYSNANSTCYHARLLL